MKNRIKQLEKQANALQMKKMVLFFDSHEEYESTKADGKIKDYHICFVDDIEEDDE